MMNQEFKHYFELSQQDRKDVFEAEAENLDTRPSYVENGY